MENIGYFLLAIVALCWLGAVLFGMISAWPYGLIGLIGISGVGILLAKVIKERLSNKEDDHYSENVEK